LGCTLLHGATCLVASQPGFCGLNPQDVPVAVDNLSRSHGLGSNMSWTSMGWICSLLAVGKQLHYTSVGTHAGRETL